MISGKRSPNSIFLVQEMLKMRPKQERLRKTGQRGESPDMDGENLMRRAQEQRVLKEA
jgi:hypothetical protein